jgi:hypothetical protein
MNYDPDDEIYTLPSPICNKIWSIRNTYKDYFFSEQAIKYEEINKIINEKIRLIALVDLNNEALQFFEKYKNDYQTFLDGLEEWTFSGSLFDPPIGVHPFLNRLEEGAGSTFTERDLIDMSIEYLAFFRTEESFTKILNNLEDSIRRLKIKLEISEKYNIKRVTKTGTNLELPVDIKYQFLKLFKYSETGPNFIKLLKAHEYISDDEKWKGISNRPGELQEAYLALKTLDLLKSVKNSTNSIKIFYRRFELIPHKLGSKGYISERALRNHNTTKDYDTFIEILKPLVPLQKKPLS